MKKILIVGAGFAGSVIARELAECGDVSVTVIDKRGHIAGNAWDPVDPKTGVRIHRYGPHIFHTSSDRIFSYLSRFTKWIDYKHQVMALVDGKGYVPLPINRETINRIYGVKLVDEKDVRSFLGEIAVPRANPKNAREYAESIYGVKLTELFFVRYTKKMWDLDLEQLPVDVLKRIPVRYDDNTEYFNDKYVCMPANGYENLFKCLLDHDAIQVNVGVEYEKAMNEEFDHIFNSMPIDVYFEECYGPLPYRSIKFRHYVISGHDQPVPTVNYTDDGPVTRITDWRLYPGCGECCDAVLTEEEPCSYEENNFERYYPVKTVDGGPQDIYEKYKKKSLMEPKVTFIGRCGQYRYFDMHQVVGNSLTIAKSFIDEMNN